MKYLKKFKPIIILLMVIVIVAVLIVIKIKLLNDDSYISNNDDTVRELEKKEDNKKEKEEIKMVSVDIKGSVVNPGVYQIDNNKLVIDVVNLAGGLNSDADTSLINLAKKVTDEMVVIIYTHDEVERAKRDKEFSLGKEVDGECICPDIKNYACLYQSNNKTSTSTNSKSTSNTNKSDANSESSGPININTATVEELQTLSGVGEAKAKAIIKYREEVGLFKTIEDIMNVSGIGESAFEKIKDNITV